MKRIAISCNYYHKLPCIIHLYSLLCHGLPVLFCHGLPAWYIVLPWIALPCVILLYMLHCHELSVTLHCHELLCVSHLKSFPFGQHHHDSPSPPHRLFHRRHNLFLRTVRQISGKHLCYSRLLYTGIFVCINVFIVFVLVPPDCLADF